MPGSSTTTWPRSRTASSGSGPWPRTRPAEAFVFPRSRQPDGSLDVWPSWCGFVLSREIVLSVGLPMGELFWWAEDTEYLQWRIPDAGYQRQVVDGAIVAHDGHPAR